MSDPTAVDLVQLFLLFVSVPAYLWFIATIIRFRKKKPFDSSFFSLCLALAAADMQCLLTNFVFGKCSSFEWLRIDELVREYPNHMGKLFTALTMYGCLQQFTGVAMISFNRCTALAYFNKHKTIWSQKFTRRMILYQFLGPLVLSTPMLVSEPQSVSYKIHNQTGQIGPVVFQNPKLQLFSGMVIASYLWVCNIFSAVMYGVSFWKVKSSNTTVQPSRGRNSNAPHARERKLTTIGVVLSTLMTIYGIVLLNLATATGQWWVFIMILWSTVNDIFSWSNPWLCLLLSPTIRRHMIAMVRWKSDALMAHKSVHTTKNHKENKEDIV